MEGGRRGSGHHHLLLLLTKMVVRRREMVGLTSYHHRGGRRHVDGGGRLGQAGQRCLAHGQLGGHGQSVHSTTSQVAGRGEILTRFFLQHGLC